MAKVAMIVPSEKMLTLAKPMLESCSHVDMVLLEHVDPGDSQKALKIARSAIAQGCELISMQEKSESLESYYVNLVGGANHG